MRDSGFTLQEDVWEDAGDGYTMRRVYRKGQRISETMAVAAGYMESPYTPPPEKLQEETEEAKPQKRRERKTVKDKARKPAKNKARKSAKGK